MSPRGYLSYSQMKLIEESPSNYRKVYFEGGTMPINRGMAFGTMVAQFLEKGKLTGDPKLDYLLHVVPKYRDMEYKMKASLKTKNGYVPLLAKMDSYHRLNFRILEYKTGETPWTQKMADDNDQLTFYATVLYLQKEVFPEAMALVYIPTEKDETGNTRVKGFFQIFPTSRNMAQILKMGSRMEKAWGMINDLYDQHLTGDLITPKDDHEEVLKEIKKDFKLTT